MRVAFTEGDFDSLDAHPLKWRWTDRRWNLLPPADLVRLRPIAEAKAAEMVGLARKLVGGRGRQSPPLAADYFEACERFWAGGDPDEGRTWLASRAPPRVTEVFVCFVEWSMPPILTDWDVFCRYWDDFCYPLSGNVLAWSTADDWAAFYHDEELLFAARRRADTPIR